MSIDPWGGGSDANPKLRVYEQNARGRDVWSDPLQRRRKNDDINGISAFVVSLLLLGLIFIASRHWSASRQAEELKAAAEKTAQINRQVELDALAHDAAQQHQNRLSRLQQEQAQAAVSQNRGSVKTSRGTQYYSQESTPRKTYDTSALDNAEEALRIMAETKQMMAPKLKYYDSSTQQTTASADRTFESPICGSARAERALIEEQMRKGFYHGQHYRDRLNNLWSTMTNLKCDMSR